MNRMRVRWGIIREGLDIPESPNSAKRMIEIIFPSLHRELEKIEERYDREYANWCDSQPR